MAGFIDGITSAAGGAIATAKQMFNNAVQTIEDFFSADDAHGVYDNKGVYPLFPGPGLGIMGISLQWEKSIASHPLETNTTRQDNTVFEPLTASVTLLAEASEVARLYETMQQLYFQNVLICVMVDGRYYNNLVMKSMPIERTPDMFDAVQVTITLHEFIYSQAVSTPMDDPSNVELAQYSNRQKAGLQRPQTVSGADEINVRSQMTVPGA